MKYFLESKLDGERYEIERWQWMRAVEAEYGPHVAATWAEEWGHRIDIGHHEYQTEEGDYA